MHNPSPALADIRRRAISLVHASLSANTKSTYSTALNNFSNFRHAYALSLQWPVPHKQMVLYVAYCFEKQYAPSTIHSYIAGISFVHKINQYPDPAANFVIQKMLEGCRRSRKRRDLRLPISIKMLKSILGSLESICFSLYETNLFKAVFSLAYLGLFRISELVHTNLQDRSLKTSDVTFDTNSGAVLVTLRISKTNQSGRPITIRIPNTVENSLLMDNIRQYNAALPASANFFFCHANLKPLTRYQFCSVLSKAGQRAGLSPLIKSHSFRIGRATDLAIAGVDCNTIKIMGRWSSTSYAGYIRM